MIKRYSFIILAVFLSSCQSKSTIDPRCNDKMHFQCDASGNIVKRFISFSERKSIFAKAMEDCKGDPVCTVKLKCYTERGGCYNLSEAEKKASRKLVAEISPKDPKNSADDHKYYIETKEKIKALFQKDMIDWQKKCEDDYMDKKGSIFVYYDVLCQGNWEYEKYGKQE